MQTFNRGTRDVDDQSRPHPGRALAGQRLYDYSRGLCRRLRRRIDTRGFRGMTTLRYRLRNAAAMRAAHFRRQTSAVMVFARVILIRTGQFLRVLRHRVTDKRHQHGHSTDQRDDSAHEHASEHKSVPKNVQTPLWGWNRKGAKDAKERRNRNRDSTASFCAGAYFKNTKRPF